MRRNTQRLMFVLSFATCLFIDWYDNCSVTVIANVGQLDVTDSGVGAGAAQVLDEDGYSSHRSDHFTFKYENVAWECWYIRE